MSVLKISRSHLRPLAFVFLLCGLSAGSAQIPIALRVTSTFNGRTSLPLRSKWIVRVFLTPSDTALGANDIYVPRDEVEAPEEDIDSVTYIVDNQVRWISRRKPYTYGGWAGYFVTTWLTPGKHTFTAKVKTTDGRTALNTVTATVAKAPAPPAALAGVWTRDIQTPESELRGKWNLIFDEVGAWVTDPTKTGVVEQISVQGDSIYVFNPIQIGLADVGAPAYGAKSISGHVCGDGRGFILQYPLSSFKWAVKGDTLTVTHIKTEDNCPARAFLWGGSWTRVKNPPPRGSLLPPKQ